MVCYISLPFSLPLMKIPNTYSTTMYPDLMNMTKKKTNRDMLSIGGTEWLLVFLFPLE